MPDHTVTVDRSGDVSSLSFSTTFNVAVPFIDRHLDEGRAGKVVIRTTGGDSVTYGTLAENVNRCGNALTGLNVLPAKRVLMIVKDYPAFSTHSGARSRPGSFRFRSTRCYAPKTINT